MERRNIGWLVGLVVLGALTRLVPHPPNFVPLGAIALASGAVMGGRALAYTVPIGAMLLADLVLGFHGQMALVYLGLAVPVWLGSRLARAPSWAGFAGATVASATLFYLLTNFGVWALDGLYPLTVAGLAASFAAGLPFFWTSLLADLLYGLLLLGLLARDGRLGRREPGPVRAAA